MCFAFTEESVLKRICAAILDCRAAQDERLEPKPAEQEVEVPIVTRAQVDEMVKLLAGLQLKVVDLEKLEIDNKMEIKRDMAAEAVKVIEVQRALGKANKGLSKVEKGLGKVKRSQGVVEDKIAVLEQRQAEAADSLRSTIVGIVKSTGPKTKEAVARMIAANNDDVVRPLVEATINNFFEPGAGGAVALERVATPWAKAFIVDNAADVFEPAFGALVKEWLLANASGALGPTFGDKMEEFMASNFETTLWPKIKASVEAAATSVYEEHFAARVRAHVQASRQLSTEETVRKLVGEELKKKEVSKNEESGSASITEQTVRHLIEGLVMSEETVKRLVAEALVEKEKAKCRDDAPANTNDTNPEPQQRTESPTPLAALYHQQHQGQEAGPSDRVDKGKGKRKLQDAEQEKEQPQTSFEQQQQQQQNTRISTSKVHPIAGSSKRIRVLDGLLIHSLTQELLLSKEDVIFHGETLNIGEDGGIAHIRRA